MKISYLMEIEPIMQSNKIVYIKDFTSPSMADSAEGIRAAIKTALETGADKIVFEAGKYKLSSYMTVETDGAVHDSGYAIAPVKDCHIFIRGSNRLTLEGAVSENGQPATLLAGHNDGVNHSFLPSILWCEDNERLTVRNLAFSREPAYTSAGVVIDKTNTDISVEVLEGNPCYDGMGAYCMNRFHPVQKSLIGESVTYGGGAETNWKHEGGRRLRLESGTVAAKVNVGELLSWHQGARTDLQTYFARCNNLVLHNLRTYNSNSFCMLTEACHNITANQVVFKPDGNRFFVGPRDAWKIFKCSGVIAIERMYIEGVRMDGQNMHSTWLFLREKISPDEALFYCKNTYAPIKEGSGVEAYNGVHSEKLVVISSSHEGRSGEGNLYRIRFDRSLPHFAVKDSLFAACCWEPERYICRSSEFVNIAGAGHLVRFDHVTITDCTYRNLMNPAILLGAEMPVHQEGGHATDIVIRGCTFDNCGFFPRYDTWGCIGVHSSGFEAPHNKNIEITENVFRSSDIGVHIFDGDQVSITNNRFENIGKKLLIDRHAVGKIIWEMNS